MTSGLKVSLICNLALAGVVIFAFARRPESPAAASPRLTEAQPAPALVQSSLFHWSQLESTNNYREYVGNLRAIGCPEATVEDITWGDAERVFLNQRQKLNLSGDEPGPWSKQREARLVAYLLGQTPPPVDVAENPAKAAPDKKSAPATYPLAFQDVNLDSLGLKDDQKKAVEQAIASIRQQFINQIGGLNQDPSDPAYLPRWRNAQPQMDDELRGWLGGKTYMSFQLAAQANSAAAQGQ